MPRPTRHRRAFAGALLGPLLGLLLGAAAAHAGNVILFVGDGTGLAQLAAARVAAHGPGGRLALDSLQDIAVVTTHSASGWTTDSAAGATAWATGRKTNNGFLSVAPDSTRLPTILEQARDAGYATGLVTTTEITHATPAAFAAHVPDRGAASLIAEQMLGARPQVLLGGGRAYWIPQDAPGSKRTDDADLLAQARDAGYRVVETATQLATVDPGRTRAVLGLFARGHLPYRYDRGVGNDSTTVPTLAAMTQTAIDVLSAAGRPGFYLMVEGGRIDHAAHANDGTRAVWEAIAFDAAVARGLAYARRHTKTLVLFVADHETGGLSVGNRHYQGFPDIPRADGFPVHAADMDSLLHLGWASKGHSAIPVLAAAAGPHAEQVRGVLDNTDLYGIMRQALGLRGD